MISVNQATKLRVALMTYSMDNRLGKGSSVYTRQLALNLLTDSRIDLTLVHYQSTTDPIYRRTTEIVMPTTGWLGPGKQFIRQLKWFWQQRRQPFDIIHWCQPRLYPFFWLAPAKKIMVTFHGGGDVTAPATFSLSRLIFIWVIKIFGRRIDLVIVDSAAAREETALAYGLPLNKIAPIHIGGGDDYLPIDRLVAETFVREHFNLTQPFILEVARLQPHKNIERLIEAYNLFRAEGDQKIDLVVVGQPSFAAAKIYRLAKQSPYAEDIKFIDYASDEELNHLYSAAQIFVFPSLNEGFGLPVVEAFAAGTPVVTSNLTALPEVAGEAALLVDPYQPADIAQAMKRLLTDGSLWEEKRRAGLERAKLFTWSKTAQETIEAYLNLFKHANR
jgi:glycosyltransferase involved in cell wall biosynthesis